MEEKEPIIDKLTFEEVVSYLEFLESKLDDFKTYAAKLSREQHKELDRIVEYKGKKVLLTSYGDDIEKIHMWVAQGNSETVIGEYKVNKADYKTTIFNVIDKVSQGLYRCNYCGKWVPASKVEKYVPAGVACDDPECRKKGRADELDFYSYPLD